MAIAVAPAVYRLTVGFLVGRPVGELAGRSAPSGAVLEGVLFGVVVLVLIATDAYSVAGSGRAWPSILGPDARGSRRPPDITALA